MTPVVLEARNIKKYFPITKGFFSKTVGQVKAVDGVSLKVHKGETLGLVGESGCGKSTLGRALIRLYEPTSGEVTFKGENYLSLKGNALRQKRTQIQMIFQDPYASLDPRMTIAQIIAEPFKIHNLMPRKDQIKRVKELIEEVGLNPSQINRYPHEFSGGQRQRISIARTIALEPQLVIADEPVSALDVSIQAQILNLLKDLQEKLQLTYIFISHDLSVVEHICDRIAVMYLGRIVEVADKKTLFSDPEHPYTQALLKAIPCVGEGKKQMKRSLSGEVPSPINPPSGCTFHPRCPHKTDRCVNEIPVLQPLKNNPTHEVACWLHNE